MKYFVPNLEPTEELKTQTTFQEKLGGLPFGLPTEMYPICKGCSTPMIFLAQFVNNKNRLDLGKEGRILYIFICDYEGIDYSVCESWDANSGANACFIVEPEILIADETKIPESKTPVLRETLITGWIELNDDITEEESRCFFETQKYFLETQKYDEIAFTEFAKLLDKTKEYTKLGGLPYWIQYPEIPKGNYKFVGQLDSDNGFEFGDIGIGYIFIEKTENSEQLPKGKFLWQCS